MSATHNQYLFLQLVRIKEATPPDSFRCIVFLRTRRGVKTTLDRIHAAEKRVHTLDMVESGSGLDNLYERLFCKENKLIPRHFVGKGTCDISESNLTQEQTRSLVNLIITFKFFFEKMV